MAIHAGRHQFGTESGRIALRTFREGLVAGAGHDLTIEVARWSADLVVAEDLSPVSLKVSADLGSLVVREGTGGLKPLTDRDKREISVTARKVLGTERFPEATFTATDFESAPGSAAGPAAAGGKIRGTLQIAGQSRPGEINVRQTGPGRYQATATIRQTDFGIKPYSAFLGSLKVKDAVEVEVEVDLSTSAEQESAA
jgi:polyisoprenoid-binding protein YceI